MPASIERMRPLVEHGMHAGREAASDLSTRARHEAELLTAVAQPVLRQQARRGSHRRRTFLVITLVAAVVAVIAMLIRRGRGDAHDYAALHRHMPPGGNPSWTPPVPVPGANAAPEAAPAWPVERSQPRESAENPAVAPTAGQDWPAAAPIAAPAEHTPAEHTPAEHTPAEHTVETPAAEESPVDDAAHYAASTSAGLTAEQREGAQPGGSANGAGTGPFTWSNRMDDLRPAAITRRPPLGRPQLPSSRAFMPPTFVRPSLPGDQTTRPPRA